MLTIGLPRSLLYYDCGPLWTDFFESLGAKVIVSPPTTKSMVDTGVSLSVDDACFPVKVYHGHAAAIADQCDYLFVPRLVSTQRSTYMCPKFLGLPDMVRAALGNSVRLISPTIDLSRSKRGMLRAAVSAGEAITRNPVQSLSVWRACQRRQDTTASWSREPKQQAKARVGVLAHQYVLQDRVLSLGLLEKLGEMNVNSVLAEDVPPSDIQLHASALGRHIFWSHEQRMYGAGMAMVSANSVQGIIIVQAFGCGPGSMIFDLFARRCRRVSTVPVLNLSIDEHTGEAGIVTRLEAFVDMLLRTERSCG
jgi:predicted nucleotide-binding protein (sugar kinase/HSP70/actin superfamily)